MGTTTDPNDISWQTTRRQVLQRDGSCCVSCGEALGPDADIHHLLPRSMGGTDELSNLVALCDGCHAAHHPNLAGGLARRAIERWAFRLAKWLDRSGTLAQGTDNFGPALRVREFIDRNPQLADVLT
jgi:ATP-dependent DNA helicase RecQ